MSKGLIGVGLFILFGCYGNDDAKEGPRTAGMLVGLALVVLGALMWDAER